MKLRGSLETSSQERRNFKGTHAKRIKKIFRWLLRNGINKMSINGVKTKVLTQDYLRLDGPKGPPICPQH